MKNSRPGRRRRSIWRSQLLAGRRPRLNSLDARYRLRGDALALEPVASHMHLRGKSFRFEAVYPDGGREILLDVPRYDFNWQLQRSAEPKRMPRGRGWSARPIGTTRPTTRPTPTRPATWAGAIRRGRNADLRLLRLHSIRKGRARGRALRSFPTRTPAPRTAMNADLRRRTDDVLSRLTQLRDSL